MIAECLVVEFSVTGDGCPLADAARETGVGIDARPPQLRSDDNALLAFSTPTPAGVEVEDGAGAAAGEASLDPGALPGAGRDRDVDPERYGPVAVALDRDDRIRYLHASRSGDRINYRCLSKRPCVVHELTDAGFMPESLGYREGGERHTGAVVGYDVLEGVLAAGAARSGGDDVGVTVERIHPLGAEDDQPVARRWSITPAQEAALRTALELGYFSVPRDADASEVAAELGIGKSAFLERLRRGQGALFAQVFGES
jgi:predicted DNA binding protein